MHRIIHTRIFEFVIGRERASFKIHSGAVAEQSDTLNNLVNGAMIEAQLGCIFWEDLSVDTFIRFIQFAYLGDYPAPASGPLTDPPGAAVPATPLFVSPAAAKTSTLESYHEASMKDAPPPIGRTNQDSMPKNTTGEVSFKDMDFAVRIPAMEFWESCKPRPNLPSEDFTKVFIAHAELYVFAEKYGVKTLKQSTLLKLHQTLAIYKINPADIRAIIELIRFAFSEENTLEDDNHVDGLRELVIAYITSESKTIGKCGEFLALLEEGGLFVKEFWLGMMKTIS